LRDRLVLDAREASAQALPATPAAPAPPADAGEPGTPRRRGRAAIEANGKP
jgi:hypothetical protein